MGTKNNPGDFDCYDAAEMDEPMFILLGRDENASKLVEQWAIRRFERLSETYSRIELPRRHSYIEKQKLLRALHKIGEALQCADAMRAYYIKRSRQGAAA